MNEAHTALEHLVTAAFDNDRAASCHLASAKRYKAGTDYTLAAHEALLARAHALRAAISGNSARNYYDRRKSEASNAVVGTAQSILATADVAATHDTSDSATHHTAAALHHHQAARHQRQAARHHRQSEWAFAAHDMLVANGHEQQSIFHDDEAALYHVQHYGRSGPTAELS